MGRKKKVKKGLIIEAESSTITNSGKQKITEKWYFSNPKDCKKDNESMSVGYEKIIDGMVMERTGEKTAYAIIKK